MIKTPNLTDNETVILALLPGTPKALAKRLRLTPAEVARTLQALRERKLAHIRRTYPGGIECYVWGQGFSEAAEPARIRIEAALRSGPHDAYAMAKAVGVSDDTARAAMEQLKSEGRVYLHSYRPSQRKGVDVRVYALGNQPDAPHPDEAAFRDRPLTQGRTFRENPLMAALYALPPTVCEEETSDA